MLNEAQCINVCLVLFAYCICAESVGGIMFIQWFMYDKAGKDGLKEVWDSRELGRINCLIGVRIREARMRE